MHELISHDQAIELLPWLVNESLEPGEQEAVAAHAASCVICRRELSELEVLQESINIEAAKVEAPAPDMRRINARIDGQLERERHGQALFVALRDFVSSPWRAAFAVQTVALAIVAGLWLQQPTTEPVFETLTTPEALPAGHYARVVFDPTLRESALRGLLDEAGLSIVAEPTVRGVYTVGFAAGLPEQERDNIIKMLVADKRVLFAQPVETGNQ